MKNHKSGMDEAGNKTSYVVDNDISLSVRGNTFTTRFPRGPLSGYSLDCGTEWRALKLLCITRGWTWNGLIALPHEQARSDRYSHQADCEQFWSWIDAIYDQVIASGSRIPLKVIVEPAVGD